MFIMRKPNINGQAVLVITGLLVKEHRAIFKNSLPETLPANTVAVFTDYSQVDFSVHQQFTKVFLIDDIDVYEDTFCELITVTQQFDKPIDIISQGWKTICVLKFPNGTPDLVNSLSYDDFETWGSIENCLGLCNEQTWMLI